MVNSGQFQKGHAKLGGRTKGTQPKAVVERKRRIEEFLSLHWEEFETKVWEELTPKDKKDTLIAMLNYVYPKLQSVDMTNTVKTQDSAINKLRELVNDDNIV